MKYLTKKTTMTFLLVVFLFLVDKLFKTLALRNLLDQPVEIIGDVFTLHFAKNYFIAFSLPLSGLILNITIGLIILILISWWVKLIFPFKPKTTPSTDQSIAQPLTFLIFGAILNFADRLQFDYVIDYFDLKYFTVFNIADVIITIATLFLISACLKNKK